MKFAIWTYTAAVCFTAFLIALDADHTGNLIENNPLKPPSAPVTAFFTSVALWLLLVPAPFCLAAFRLTFRRAVTAQACFVFASVATFTIAALIVIWVSSLVGEFVPIILHIR